MDVDYLHVSAFTQVPGEGNSAAVCELASWPGDDLLANIARRIALPVTSFLRPVAGSIELRWFSRSGMPVASMCGHGTLAASCVMALARPEEKDFSFRTPGGVVNVQRQGELFQLTLPRWESRPVEVSAELSAALGRTPAQVLDAGRDVIARYATEAEVRNLSPEMPKLLALGRRGFIATAPGTDFDCVSRFFCPSFGLGVDEDPVTGSAHCSIAPLWARLLGKSRLRAFQASTKGGELLCEVLPSAVMIAAPAVLHSRGRVTV